MSFTKFDTPLIEDKDYILMDGPYIDPVFNKTHEQAQHVYVADTNTTGWLCMECKAFLGDTGTSAVMHWNRNHRPKGPKVAARDRRARAFALLPKAVQDKLLAQLDAEDAT